jgi:hypothetical protein
MNMSIQEETNAQIEVFLRWRESWQRLEEAPEDIVPGLNHLANEIIYYWRTRITGLAKYVTERDHWEESVNAALGVLLDPDIPYEYKGIPQAITYFAFKVKPFLLEAVKNAHYSTFDEDIQVGSTPPNEILIPLFEDSITERVKSALTVWYERSRMEKKWIALLVLRQQHEWVDIVILLQSIPTPEDENMWARLCEEVALPILDPPKWCEVHEWFATPPPLIVDNAYALKKFFSRLSRHFQTDLLENF